MALRFRRSLKLAPGLRMNLSRGGLSWSIGPRGASMSFGKRGAAANLGLPGTGLSVRQTLGSGAPRRQNESVQGGTALKSAAVSVDASGKLSFVEAETLEPLDDHWITLIKQQNADGIKKLIADKVAEINAAIDTLGSLHQYTPAPVAPTYELAAFDLPKPERPIERQMGVIAGLMSSKREVVERENADASALYERELLKWRQFQQSHTGRELRKKQRAELGVLTEVDAMEAQLEDNLADITWPRETEVSFEVRADGDLCVLDVDLPEIEHMPTVEAAVTGRGFEVKQKDLSDTRRRRLYMAHIHAIAVRLIGEVFATLPRCEKVVVSGYSQRTDARTGSPTNEYLLSVGVDRSAWREINFSALASVDPVSALERFELRRAMSKTGVFKAVEPLM